MILACVAAFAAVSSGCIRETEVVRQIDPEAKAHYDAAFKVLGEGASTPETGKEEASSDGDRNQRAPESDTESRLTAAIAELGKAVAIQKEKQQDDYSQAYFQRALLYQMMGKTEEAISDADMVVQLTPNEALGYSLRGALYELGLGDHERAIQDLDKAIELESRNSLGAAYYHRAEAYVNSSRPGRYEQAVQDYSVVIDRKLEFGPHSVYERRGEAYAAVRQYEKAVEDLGKAIVANPAGAASAYHKRAIVYTQWDNDAKAGEDVTVALKMGADPEKLEREIEEAKARR